MECAILNVNKIVSDGNLIFVYPARYIDADTKALFLKRDNQFLGYLMIEKIITDTVSNLWRLYFQDMKMSSADFEQYFSGFRTGHIVIAEYLHIYREPISIEEVQQ